MTVAHPLQKICGHCGKESCMIRPICKDIIVLSQKSVPATKADTPVFYDVPLLLN